jgi:hypothetical protein
LTGGVVARRVRSSTVEHDGSRQVEDKSVASVQWTARVFRSALARGTRGVDALAVGGLLGLDLLYRQEIVDSACGA